MIIPAYDGVSKNSNNLLTALIKEIPSLQGNIKDIPIAIISIHGWTPRALVDVWKTDKQSDVMAQNMAAQLCKKLGIRRYGGNITLIPLKGFDLVSKRAYRFSEQINANTEWLNGLKNAKIVFVIGHSQGCPTSIILLERLFNKGIIIPATQRICLMLMSGVHEGPTPRFEFVRPLAEELGEKSTFELFDFQNSKSEISGIFHKAYSTVINSGVKIVHLGVGNDEVVPLHSSLFTSVEHPSIHRAVYVNDTIYQQEQFLADFVALLIKILNHGHSDSGLLGYISEILIGALSDEGHSSIIHQDEAYRRAIDVFFDSTFTSQEPIPTPTFYEFNYTSPQMKPCFIAWAMKGVLMNDALIASEHLGPEIREFCNRFLQWNPTGPQSLSLKTALEPIGDFRERKAIRVLQESEPVKS